MKFGSFVGSFGASGLVGFSGLVLFDAEALFSADKTTNGKDKGVANDNVLKILFHFLLIVFNLLYA
ncbi:Uncharacterised protein [Mycoplasmopsis edwardii]|uniref:Uncharacterized protein n=1 Tax=Mycoplasmopsis edwardii TaxID=53558 RepID=A0A3B0PP46_9BACT|nr:Uncharacterised protein [Mycoplasmopsis edwardii]